MKRTIIYILGLVLIILAVFLSYKKPAKENTSDNQNINPNVTMKITSTAFEQNSKIPDIYSCKGVNINPPLSFENIPSNAKSLALVLHDPDAPLSGGFTHWVVFNMPPDTKSIAENSTPAGIQANNGAGQNKYTGPCPPSGTHHYRFNLYALDAMLDASKISDKTSLEASMQNHIIDQAELIGLFSK